jgi:hypothetical protein
MKKIGVDFMTLSRRSLYLIIINLYFTPLVFANNFISSFIGLNGIEKYLIILAPSLLICSFLYDTIKDWKHIKLIKSNLYISIIFTLIAIATIFLGINISMFSIKALIHLAIIVGLGFFLYTVNIKEADFKLIKKHAFIVLGIVVAVGLFQYIFDLGLTNKIDSAKYIGIKGRVISTYHIATVLDKFLIMMMVILSYELLKVKDNSKSLLYILSGTVLALTFTRAGIIAYVALTIFFVGASIIKKKYFNLLIIAITTIGMFVVPGYKYAFQSAADYVYQALRIPTFLQLQIVSKQEVEKYEIPDITEDESITYRNYYEEVGMAVVKEYPITGIGLGNYAYLYNNQNVNDYLKNKLVLPSEYMYPHNGYIQTTAEIGILGLLTYLAFFGSFLIKMKDIKLHKWLNLYPCVLLLFFFLLGTYTEGLFTTKQYMYVFMIIYPLYCNYIIKHKKLELN